MSSLDHRVPEPIWDDRRDEAEVYHAMDHTEVNRQFVADLLGGGAVGPDVYDIGAGTGLIASELCGQCDDVRVMAIDAEIEMLEIARHVIDAAGLLDRITPALGDLVSLDGFATDSADTVISNTVLHHLADPSQFFPALVRVLKPGGRLFVRDLIRPANECDLETLAARHAGGESPEATTMFTDSLRAALTLEEIRSLAGGFGIDAECIEVTSDRHWTLDWVQD